MHFRNRLIWQLPVLLLACAFNATPIGSNATYQFVGQCSDCTGTGTATLVLQNYTLGTQLANANFVSLAYSSNLISFTLTAADSPGISGMIPANLPAAAVVSIGANVFNNPKQLETQTGGNPNARWCAGVSCFQDQGINGTWSLPSAPAPTPVSTPALSDSLLIGLAAGIAVMGGILLKTRTA